MLLQAVLDLGNMLNSRTGKGHASGFKISNLLRLGDMKSSDKATTALKFLLTELETQHDVALPTFLQRDMTHLKTASGDGQVRSQRNFSSTIHLQGTPLIRYVTALSN